VINDVSSLAGVTIIADDTIKEQTVSIEFKNEPIDSVVEKLALIAGAYSKQQSPGVYIISKATVESAFFQKFAETRIYNVQNQTAASIQALLNLSYKPYLSVDPKTNTIGVCAPRQLADKILADIQKADRPGRQIYVEALVTEISAEDSMNTSFNGAHGKWSLGTNLGITTQAAGFADLAQINALIGTHKMKLRANPHLIATAGMESTVNVGQDTYYSILSGSTIYPTSQIQLIHTGVVLKFTATIGDDGLITMQLAPSVSDAVVNVNGNPTSNIRNADTRVRVKSGETIIIAGLTQESGDKQVVRVPLLGYIPLVGELFTQRSMNMKKVETVFLITPRVMDDK
jgi:type II secretory pathway component GspD/PulD (secretin)